MRRLMVALAILTIAGAGGVARAGGGDRLPTLALAADQGIATMVALAMESMVNDLVPGARARTDSVNSEATVLQRVSEGRATLGIVTIPEIARVFPTSEARAGARLSFVMGGHAATVVHVFLREDLPSPTLEGLRGRRKGLGSTPRGVQSGPLQRRAGFTRVSRPGS